MKKTIQAIKFKNFCQNNNLNAQDIANKLNVSKALVYKYWSGGCPVSDENKKKLEKEINLPIYEIFFNDSLDNEVITIKKSYLELLEKYVK